MFEIQEQGNGSCPHGAHGGLLPPVQTDAEASNYSATESALLEAGVKGETVQECLILKEGSG